MKIFFIAMSIFYFFALLYITNRLDDIVELLKEIKTQIKYVVRR